ncbi:hypothetical protein L6270_00635 [Candidatus Parcubacteria bacterium]|nr:hypothetical protein [Patescibacteria group bacterium]MBU4309656.1 hypothetical protein [Patescibacteria group bacterium]MBU4432040.1 hypothetical protein [Patescibacteria group bacterium]MBU4577956.1 hypothetical protein [Patescibacteria group bacterium]MCG2696535.1 hypothetical protein [Candidatus Parcubacteria bacterium]
MEIEIEKILSLTKKKMNESGAYSREAFEQFVEEAIDYYLQKGELSDDDNLEFIEDQVMEMYDVVKETISDDGGINEETFYNF